MRIRRTTTTLLLGGALAMGLAAPAVAGPRGEYQDLQHTSCKAFGNGFADWVQMDDADFDGDPDETGEAGEWMAASARGQGVAGVIHEEQFYGIKPNPVPLCDLKTD
jgi:hypothetical protein